MERIQSRSQNFGSIEKVPYIGAGVILANITIAIFIYGREILPEYSVPYNNLAERGKRLAGPSFPCRQRAVEKVYTAADRLEQIFRLAHPHQISRFVFGQMFTAMRNNFVSGRFILSHRQTAESIPLDIELCPQGFHDNAEICRTELQGRINATDPEEALYTSLKKSISLEEEGLETEQIIVNMGPQHPSTHGVFRAVVTLDGETVTSLKPVMGYLHRNHEKIGERNTFLQNMPYTDRLDYFNSMSNNWGYALAVEKLMGIEVAERAEYIRTIMAELSRIQNHLIWIGMMLNDLGTYFTPALYAFEERELILDIFEAASGSRMMCNYYRFGGVVRDIPKPAFEKIKGLVFDRLPEKITEFERLLSENEILISRLKGIGYLSAQDAIAYSMTGPVLRASGVPYDIRRAEPYGIYDIFDFEVVTNDEGDMYARYVVRIEEMRQSLRILEQALKGIPEGSVMSVKPQYQVRVPAGEAYGRIEAPKGELGFYVVSNGKPNPWRYHVRAPSFINLTALEKMCVGNKIADFVAILGAIDIVLGELDR